MYLLFLLFSTMAWSHQTSITSSGSALYWPDPRIPIYIHTNTTDLTPAQTYSLINTSMNEWNSTQAVTVSPASASKNEVRFSKDFSIYGSAVIGITEISYNSAGAISRAVILLNDNYTFTSRADSFANGSIFLSDVVTHELGHLFGLSHSEILNSSMFYTSFPGQSTIAADDRAGILHKYGGSKGSITGKVQGGNHIGVLGVHVQVISRKTGEMVGVVSDEEGNFVVKGLELDDTYYIYTSPLKKVDSLPGHFANTQTEFCPGSYVGSFFSPCGREFEGFPQGITLKADKSEVDVGVVTINCGLKANEEYSYQKVQTSFDHVTIWHPEEGGLREKSFVGYFGKLPDANWSQWETLKLDLTGVPAAPGRSMKVNFLSHPFGGKLEYEMRVISNGSLTTGAAITSSSILGTFNTDMSAQVNLNSNSSFNIFEIQIRARKLTSSMVPFTFPSATVFASETHLPYLLVVGLWDNLTPLFNTESNLSDNESCLEAPFTYKVNEAKMVSDKAAGSPPGTDAAAQVSGAACGSIGPSGGSGPGTSALLMSLGFVLALLGGELSKKSKKFLS